MEIKGIINPVIAVKLFLKSMKLNVDEPSFNSVATKINKKGFIVESLDDIRKLCKIGKFKVIIIKGKFHAKSFYPKYLIL